MESTNIDSNINKLNEYEKRGSDFDFDFKDCDKRYKTSDDLTLSKDHKLINNPNQQEEDQ